MKTLEQYKNEIETRLDLPKDLLSIEGNKILPGKSLNKTNIKKYLLDDLFQVHQGKIVFSLRFMSLVGELTNRELKTGRYFLALE